MFRLAYSSVEEYGVEYAVINSLDNVGSSFTDENSGCFAFEYMADSDSQDKIQLLYGTEVIKYNESELIDSMSELSDEIEKKTSIISESSNKENDSNITTEENTTAYGVRKINNKEMFIAVSRNKLSDRDIYIGISRDISSIYEDREELLGRYRLALAGLIVIGFVSIYFLSRFMTGPIRTLEKVTGEIAEGNLSRRSHYHSEDEIGKLSDSLNVMADRISMQMQEISEEAAKKELAAKQKADFTAAFAHELKTPLTSIIGYADMLNTIEVSEEEKRDAYYYIYNQGKRLESLSHKLLELVSMENDNLELRQINTLDIQENLKNTMRPIFRSRQIKGKITLEKSVIYGDYELLLSLFYNLLDNAVKAVEKEGYILFKGTVEEEGYRIKVVDNGRGIPENEIGRITEAFYMVDKSRSRKEGGAGIGLALCSRIIELHGATLQIASKPGEGTVMCVTFPKH
jgi:signal transduction histidine kinase